MTRRTLPILAAASVAATALAIAETLAAGRARSSVTACSRYGNGCATAPVRQGRWGGELRLKGGTWIDCRGDCRETLREEALDFWETQNAKARIIAR